MFRFFIKEKFTILLVLALVNVIAAPFLPSAVSLELFLDISFTLVILAAVLSVSKGKRISLAGAVGLMLPCLFFIWWTYLFTFHSRVMLASTILQVVFIVYIAFLILLSVLNAPKVNRDVISAALVVYIFIATFFSKLYLMLELNFPGSFSIPHETLMQNPEVLRYFSIVTLSTLGYGDVLPVTAKAQTMAGVEAIVGQIYLAVLIARLVSLHGVEFLDKKNGKNHDN